MTSVELEATFAAAHKRLRVSGAYRPQAPDAFLENLFFLLEKSYVFFPVQNGQQLLQNINISAAELLQKGGTPVLETVCSAYIQEGVMRLSDKYFGDLFDLYPGCVIYQSGKTAALLNTTGPEADAVLLRQLELDESDYDALVWQAVVQQLRRCCARLDDKPKEAFTAIVDKLLRESVSLALYLFVYNKPLVPNGPPFKLSIDIAHIRRDGIAALKETAPDLYIEYDNNRYPILELGNLLTEALKRQTAI